ncbi:MAG TPA: TolC family protein [Gemmatimonadaceae bacterium]|nr:TolC family protein [Gemmatimonadaceae bacterium]
MKLILAFSFIIVTAAAPQAWAQPDTLRLGGELKLAERADRRAAQRELLQAQSRLRQESFGAERLPSIMLLGQGQYLSDVPSVRALLPAGLAPGDPPHDNYDAYLGARQRLYDPSLAPRRAVERAQLAESEARLGSTLFAQRLAVNEAFFAALLLDAQRETLEAGITDLEAQRRLAGERVAAGAALPSEAAAIEAELIRRQQSTATLAADREAAREVLGTLVGRVIGTATVLELPEDASAGADSARPITAVRPDSAGRRATRPEFEQFARGRDLLAERRAAAAAQDRPRVSAFGRAGYGRPGLNPLAREFDTFWLAGVQLEWSPWNWGTTRREQQELALQAQILSSEEAAFAASLDRALIRARASIAHLEQSLAQDDRIIALHEGILRETRLRFTEGTVTAAEYVDRQTDVLTSQLARATRRVQLAEARARLLTTLGLEVR